MPAPPAAASRSSLGGRAHAMHLLGTGHGKLVLPAWGILHDWRMAVRTERWEPAPHSPTTHSVALGSSVQAWASGLLSHAVAASWEAGQQLVAQGHLAHTILASPARTSPVPLEGPRMFGSVVVQIQTQEQQWRSIVTRCCWALHWAFSWSCLRGQGEQQHPATAPGGSQKMATGPEDARFPG